MEIVTGRPPFPWAESVQYSQSVAAGDLVFTAGQGGFDDDGTRVRAELLTPPYPAGTAVQATLLIDGMLFEMDAVAVRGGVRRAQ